MNKRIIASVGVAVGVAAGAMTLAPAAQAAPSGCDSGALCAYWASNYGGSVQRVYQNNTDLTAFTNFYYAQGGSLYNNGASCNVTVYTGTSYSGSHYNLNRGTGWTTIGSNLPHIESNYWCGY